MDENKEMLMVPYVMYRDAAAQDRWVIRGLIVALMIAVLLMFGSNLAWLYVWNQYEYVGEETCTTVDSMGTGIANYTGGNGGVMYGESDGLYSEDISD